MGLCISKNSLVDPPKSTSQQLDKAYKMGESQAGLVRASKSLNVPIITHLGMELCSSYDSTQYDKFNEDCKEQYRKGYYETMRFPVLYYPKLGFTA
jgi:hypothetical protein